MSSPHHDPRRNRRGKRRGPHAAHERAPAPVPLTEEGLPAAAPDAPRPSPAVFVSEDSRAAYPWLPRRVIAGSVWRGPHHERVIVDASGNAARWRSGPATGR